jgi:hypothetical protein
MPNINSPAAANYRGNLRLFRELVTQPDGFKLAYDSSTGLFVVQDGGLITALKRTYAGDQSVTNDAAFARPIRDIFLEAVLSGEQAAELEKALNGLRKLRNTYKGEAAKLKKLNDLLAELRDAIQGADRSDAVFLEKWKQADPRSCFTKEDLKFLKKIFADKTIMDQGSALLRNRGEASPALLSMQIYRKYNEVIGGEQIPNGQRKSWLQTLPKEFEPSLQNSPWFNPSTGKNEPMPVHGNENRIVASRDLGSDFIYYSTPQRRLREQLWRVYLNFHFKDASAVLKTIVDRSAHNKVSSFKIAGPANFHTRCDKIVAYVYSKDQAEKLAYTLKNAHPKAFLDPVPNMTIRHFAGIALGAEPASVGLGFDSHEGQRVRDPQGKDRGPDNRKSYGSIRSDLLASAVLHYHENKEVFCGGKPPLATEENAFLKCAAVAFQGYAAELQGKIAKLRAQQQNNKSNT